MTFYFAAFVLLWALVGSKNLPKVLLYLALAAIAAAIGNVLTWFAQLFPESSQDLVFFSTIIAVLMAPFLLVLLLLYQMRGERPQSLAEVLASLEDAPPR